MNPEKADNWEFLMPAYGTMCRTRLQASKYLEHGNVAINIFVADDTTMIFRYYDTLTFDVEGLWRDEIAISPNIHPETLRAVIESGVIEDNPRRTVTVAGIDSPLPVFKLAQNALEWVEAQPSVLDYYFYSASEQQ